MFQEYLLYNNVTKPHHIEKARWSAEYSLVSSNVNRSVIFIGNLEELALFKGYLVSLNTTQVKVNHYTTLSQLHKDLGSDLSHFYYSTGKSMRNDDCLSGFKFGRRTTKHYTHKMIQLEQSGVIFP